MALKVLVVDDEPQALKLVKAVVEPLGYEILALTDSREAALRLEKQKFDGAFVDARMPHLDGFELTRRIRSSRSNAKIPVVMITGYDDLETMRRGFKEGITFFLGKPFNVDKLRGLLNAMRSAMLREKRRYARLPLRTVVNCVQGDRRFKSGSLNISANGILLEPSGGLEVGQEVELQFMLPGASKSVSSRAKVVRKEPADRVGVRFMAVTPEDQELIQSYILGGLKD